MKEFMIKDKKKGCMYGLAIGDALGAAVEFRDPGTFPLVTEYRAGGPHGIDAGEWTDDTSMALALADSIAHGWDAKDQLERYVDWWQHGKYSVNNWCFDIGGTTRDALGDFMQTGILEGPSYAGASGNGSIMRLAPVVIKYHGQKDLIQKAIESSKVTHASHLCKSSCKFLASFLSHLFTSKTKLCALAETWNLGGLDLVNDLDAMISSYIFPHVHDDPGKNIRGTGFVIDSLRAALWSFMTSNSFEETVMKAVNLGDDADSTGAVAGQMAGAFWGYDAIPTKLIDGLAKKDMIDLYLNPIIE